MALIVEDGSVVEGANAYCSVAFADAYHLARGNETTWVDLDVENKEYALIAATDYLTQTFRHRWSGMRVSANQPLDWPRIDVEIDGFDVPSTSVPDVVKTSCAALALRATKAPLTRDEGRARHSVTVGPISTTYVAGSSQQTRFMSVERALAPLFGVGALNSRIYRA